ncbi:MAG: DNA methyltransferase, partial [Rubrobacteraceae bacterium]|nr:DNA methyltransferase [Rubrobacteraceae bacterium]
MAPYTVAHMKLGILLRELGYDFSGDERLRVYLTNTLEEGFHPDETIGFAEYIADEADAAASVKKDEPIEVIIGNPPYSGHSANTGDWITSLIDAYKKVDGKPLGERKHWLNDDYVKFIRFGQWRIERTGRGVLAFVTNHGYLDNPTFRGMRQSLMQTFTDIYLIDLHGNSLKKERTPEGGEDRNVFDIRQGVAIGVFVKEPGKTGPARVHHADLWGLREGKYRWLEEQSIAGMEWTELALDPPNYLFSPQDTELLEEYEKGWKTTEILPVNTTGIVTARDKFVMDFDEASLLNRIEDLRSERLSDEQIRGRYFTGKGAAQYPAGDSRGWKLPAARKQVIADPEWKERVEKCLYRPFDARLLYYVPWMVDWPRPEVMRHVLAGKNLSLITARQNKGDYGVYATTNIGTHKTVAAYDINYYFPLYLYPRDDNLLDAAEEGRRPNLSPDFVGELSEKLGLSFVPDGTGDLAEMFGPEDVFHYAYAVFHSPAYRELYAEFLKRDFPRLPLTSERGLFAALAGKGAELVGLHLMTSPTLNNLITRFPEGGDNVVEKVRYDAANKRVHINNTQYFEGVPEETWGFRVGGYQVLDKWLKDRRGRALTSADVRHYQRIVVALTETRRLMREIDETIPGWPMG